MIEDPAEIIIVDDASQPSVESVLQEYTVNPRIRILRNESRQQQPRSRMIGVAAATEPFVFFGEDDAYLSPGCLENLLRMITSQVADIVAPQCITTSHLPEQSRPPDKCRAALDVADIIDLRHCTIRSSDAAPVHPINVPWLHTLALMRRGVIERIGFDTKYQGNAFREETDFYLSATAAGAQLAYVPGPSIYHYKGPLNAGGGQHGPWSVPSFLCYEFWVARNNVYFLRKNRARLEALGRRTYPLVDTGLMMIRRCLGYPGRFRAALGNRA